MGGIDGQTINFHTEGSLVNQIVDTALVLGKNRKGVLQ